MASAGPALGAGRRPLLISLAVRVASAPARVRGDSGSERLALGRCAGREAAPLCGPAREELGSDALEVLAQIETDAGCASVEPPDLWAKPWWGRAPPPTPLVTCALPAALSLEIFAIAVALQSSRCSASSRRSGGVAAGDSGTAPSDDFGCDAAAALNSIRRVYGRFRAQAAAAAASLALAPAELAASVRRFVHEENVFIANVLSALWAPEEQRRWETEPSALGAAAVEAARRVGLSRRVLFWRANMLHEVVGFGLVGYLPLVAPRGVFFHSRVELLSELLSSLPMQEVRFVEVGVHLARLAFALLSTHQGLRYVGVDPFEYDGALTDAASTLRQLRDLGLADAGELRSEVREAAEAKLALFPGRAELLVLPSVEAASMLPDASVDGVFIDGDHSYVQVVRDLAAWEPKVRPGGFLSGHDFGNHPGVAKAVLERAAAGNRTVHLAMDWVWYWHV